MLPILPGLGGDIFNSSYPILIAIVIGFIFGLRHYFKGAQWTTAPSMAGKVVIVTGANSGIGLELVKLFGSLDAKVIMACRNVNKYEKSLEEIKLLKPDANVKFMKLDLSSFKSIKNFAEQFNKSESRLDVLVNNAGVMNPDDNDNDVTEDGYDWVLQVNYLGHFLLTHLLKTSLDRTQGSRVINNTAHAYKLSDDTFAKFLTHAFEEFDNSGIDSNLDTPNVETNKDSSKKDLNDFTDANERIKFVFQKFKSLKCNKLLSGGPYSLSKLTLILLTKHMSSRFGENPTINVANPGIVRTALYKNMPFRKNPIINISFAPFFWFFTKGPKDGAQTPLYCATAPALKGVTGKYFQDCSEKILDDLVTKDDVGGLIYEASLHMCGLNN